MISEKYSIFILGCGYLGYNIARFLSEYQCNITVIGFQNEYSCKLKDLPVDFIERDAIQFCTDKQDLLNDKVIINCIGSINATVENSKLKNDIENNYIQYIDLIDVISSKSVKGYIHLSSGGTVYGDSKNGLSCKETDRENPLNIYGLQKLFYEKYLFIKKQEFPNFNFIILRLANPFGGYQLKEKNQGIIPIMIRNCILENEMMIWSSLNNTRDYIYLDDVSLFIKKIIQNNIFNGEILNIGSGVGTTINDLKILIENALGKALKIKQVDLNSITNIEYNVLNIDKAIDKGLKINTNLKNGINLEKDRIFKEFDV